MLGKKIRYQRKIKKLTQAELGSRAFGVSKSIGQTRIKLFELEKGRAPTDQELHKICLALGIDFATLKQSPEDKNDKLKSPCSRNECLIQIAADRYFPELVPYAEMCVNAMRQDDEDLLMRIVESLAKKVIESVKKRRKIDNASDKRLHMQDDKSISRTSLESGK